jgi:hypothetical protein
MTLTDHIVSRRYEPIQPQALALEADQLVSRLRDSGQAASPRWQAVDDKGYAAAIMLGRVGFPDDTDVELRLWAPHGQSGSAIVSIGGYVIVCSNGMRAFRGAETRIAHYRSAEHRMTAALRLASSAVAEATLYGESLLPLVKRRLSSAAIREGADRIAKLVTGAESGIAVDRLSDRIIETVYAPQNQISDSRRGTAYGLATSALDVLEHGGRRSPSSRARSNFDGSGPQLRFQDEVLELVGTL